MVITNEVSTAELASRYGTLHEGTINGHFVLSLGIAFLLGGFVMKYQTAKEEEDNKRKAYNNQLRKALNKKDKKNGRKKLNPLFTLLKAAAALRQTSFSKLLKPT